MKPYDELTLEEKQELIREALTEWHEGYILYRAFSYSETVVMCLLTNYNAEYYRNHCSTPNQEQTKDIINILHSMPEYLLYPGYMKDKQSQFSKFFVIN